MNMEVPSSQSCVPRRHYTGRTLVLGSEGSKPIPFMEKYMHIPTDLSFLFVYLLEASTHNMNGPSGIIYMETSKYVCFGVGFDKLKCSASLPGYRSVQGLTTALRSGL